MNITGIPVMVNGVMYSWGNISLTVFGVVITGITEIKWKKSQGKDNLYGRGFDAIGRGYSNKEYEASIKIYRDELVRIINASPNKDVTDIPPFSITVTFGSTTTPPQTVVLKFAEFLQDIMEVSQGDSKILCDMPIIYAGLENK